MRNFSARETEWLQELDGIELAGFWPRAFAFALDWIIVGVVFSALATAIAAGVFAYMHHHGKSLDDMTHMISTNQKGDKVELEFGPGPSAKHYEMDEKNSKTGEVIKVVTDVVVPILYFGILLWRGKGQTPGKRLMKIRVVSLMHRHITFWHALERALGYGAAALEGGFGFVQFFIHPYRRCAQDRLAETIVVTERSYKAFQHKFSHPLLPDIPENEHAPE